VPKDRILMFQPQILGKDFQKCNFRHICGRVRETKTLFTLVNRPLKVISRDTISDMSSDILTKQVMAIVDCTMMFLAKVGNFCLSRMKGCRSYYVFFHPSLMINVIDHE